MTDPAIEAAAKEIAEGNCTAPRDDYGDMPSAYVEASKAAPREVRADGDDLEDFHEEVRGAVLDAAEVFRNGGDVRDMHRILAEGAKRAATSPPSGNAGEGAIDLLIKKNYEASAILKCIAYVDEVACNKGSADDAAAALRELLKNWLAAPPQPAPDAVRERIAKIVCCHGACILEGCDPGCIALSPEHPVALETADLILAALSAPLPSGEPLAGDGGVPVGHMRDSP